MNDAMETSHSSGFVSMHLSTSDSLLSSQYAKVIFHNIPARYSCDQDLECCFSIRAEEFEGKFGDRVALFKLGWHSITDYELFEWTTSPQLNTKCKIVFEACNLPKDPNEFYQFCYINSENEICGASIPFQFSVPQNQSVSNTSNLSQTFRPIQDPNSCTNCIKVKKQNDFLEKTISHVNQKMHRYDGEINDLKKTVDTLKQMLSASPRDCDYKSRLEVAGEEFKKLYVEKKRIEKKYDKLVKKCLDSKKRLTDDDELPPLPAFPLPMEPM